MDKMSKFKVSESFKDYFVNTLNQHPELALSDEAINDAGPMIADAHEHFKEITEEKGTLEAVRYLWDVCGYYMVLCGDLVRHNKELINLLEETLERLPDE